MLNQVKTKNISLLFSGKGVKVKIPYSQEREGVKVRCHLPHDWSSLCLVTVQNPRCTEYKPGIDTWGWWLRGSVEASGRRETRRTWPEGAVFYISSPFSCLSFQKSCRCGAGSPLNGTNLTQHHACSSHFTAANWLLVLFCPWTPMYSSGVWVFFHFSKSSFSHHVNTLM